MIAFIKNYNISLIRKKLFILYFLNVTDIIFTLLLLQTGYFSEVNILMVKAVQNPALSLCMKIFLPAILLYYLYLKIKSSEEDALRVSNIAINISLTIYALVNLSHLVWVALLPVFARIA
ncbi:MAG TPA: DUF5658 family protein [Mobilitalea sp.]|nr:DUF5658 family protein [Mobilitalea sp.]